MFTSRQGLLIVLWLAGCQQVFPFRNPPQAITIKPIMKPVFFPTATAFREWLTEHHGTQTELLVGLFKKDSGEASITWPESVDEALCYGWIDGIRKRIDERSYTIRFTPRKPGSNWSQRNISRVQILIEQGRMNNAGLTAFEARRENKPGDYPFEQRRPQLEPPYEKLLKKDKAAWTFFESQPPSYRKAVSWWIDSAKQEGTRLRRLEKLRLFSSRGQRIPEYSSKTSR